MLEPHFPSTIGCFEDNQVFPHKASEMGSDHLTFCVRQMLIEKPEGVAYLEQQQDAADVKLWRICAKGLKNEAAHKRVSREKLTGTGLKLRTLLARLLPGFIEDENFRAPILSKASQLREV